MTKGCMCTRTALKSVAGNCRQDHCGEMRTIASKLVLSIPRPSRAYIHMQEKGFANNDLDLISCRLCLKRNLHMTLAYNDLDLICCMRDAAEACRSNPGVLGVQEANFTCLGDAQEDTSLIRGQVKVEALMANPQD